MNLVNHDYYHQNQSIMNKIESPEDYKLPPMGIPSNWASTNQLTDCKLPPILPYPQTSRSQTLPSLKQLHIFSFTDSYSVPASNLTSPVDSNFASSSSSPQSPTRTLRPYEPTFTHDELRANSPEYTQKTRPNMSKRTSISKQQTSILNEYYLVNHYPNQEEKLKLSRMLNLSERTIQIWFQNRRQNRRTRFNPRP
jgi:hypothetical protein